MRVFVLLFVTSVLGSFCMNGAYHYNLTYSSGRTYDTVVKSFSNAIVIDPVTLRTYSKNVADLKRNDYVMGDGEYTWIKSIELVNISNPQLYFRKNMAGRDGYIEASVALQSDYDNIIFADSEISVLNKTVKYFGYGNTNVMQFGVFNFTDIHYDIFNAGEIIYYGLGGVDVMNMAAILDYISSNEITSYSYTGYEYKINRAEILECVGVNIVTDSGSITINGLLFH
jgi:hypothetical protein